MRPWRFVDYQLDEAECPLIEDWYELQSPEVRAEFIDIVDILSRTRLWGGREDIEELKERHVGLWWIRIKVARVHYRVLGYVRYFPDVLNQGEFVLLLGCCKSGGQVTTPPYAGDIALCLKRRFEERGEGELHEHFI